MDIQFHGNFKEPKYVHVYILPRNEAFYSIHCIYISTVSTQVWFIIATFSQQCSAPFPLLLKIKEYLHSSAVFAMAVLICPELNPTM